MSGQLWRKCDVCNKAISFGGIYQKCSVSTCSKRVYCSPTCWDVHVPVMNHKSAWCEEERAPRSGESESAPKRRIVATSSSKRQKEAKGSIPMDILIVASKLKAYIKARSGMNTSGNVMEMLSDIVRLHADEAIEQARSEGRKTVMDRDFKKGP